jgi:hypothetical protein
MKKLITLIIVLAVLFSGFVFYWFQWRPSHIRESCAKESSRSVGVDTIGIGLDKNKIYTLDELGQSIKEKCLAYNNLSNIEVANKTIAKYPEYEAFVKTIFDSSNYENCLRESGLNK